MYSRVRTYASTVFWLALTVGAIFIAVDFNKRMDEYTCDPAEQTVYAGDTLWRIVTNHCIGNISRAVDDHVEFYGAQIDIGQTIFLKQNQNCELRWTDGGQVMEDC